MHLDLIFSQQSEPTIAAGDVSGTSSSKESTPSRALHDVGLLSGSEYMVVWLQGIPEISENVSFGATK